MGKMTFSYSPPRPPPQVGCLRGAPSHKLSIDIEQFKTENFQRTKQHMVSRHGRQVWHARSLWHDMKHCHLNSKISRNVILQVTFAGLFDNRLCCD